MAGALLGGNLGPVVREIIPPWTIPLFYLITQLGNIGVLLVVFALDYWFGNAKRGAHAISLAIGGMAVVTALKYHFAIPRPPAEVRLIAITGYGFPSGHALAATIAYGVLAYDHKIGSWPVRYGAASVLIVLVALSRVALGVHSVGDVVAGVLFGVAFLAGAIVLTRHTPRPGFLLALGLGVVAFVVSGASHDGAAVLGAASGAVLVWESLETVPSVESLQSRLVLLAGVLPVLVGLGYLSRLTSLPLAIVFVLNGGIVGGLLVAPRLVD